MIKTWFEEHIADFTLKNILLLLSPTILVTILVLLVWVVPETIAAVIAITSILFVIIVAGLWMPFLFGVVVMDIFGVHTRFFGW